MCFQVILRNQSHIAVCPKYQKEACLATCSIRGQVPFWLGLFNQAAFIVVNKAVDLSGEIENLRPFGCPRTICTCVVFHNYKGG